ncbi:MAG: hypothetical protein EBW68_10110 [Actinobacteria bacterium]|nr:hypothetical protein [Actinomycetota bacterium]
MDDVVLTVHLVSACIMVGVIWFVQLVHYPLLAVVPVESAKQVAEKHQRWTGIVVGPPMAVEGVATLILWANNNARPALMFFSNLLRALYWHDCQQWIMH